MTTTVATSPVRRHHGSTPGSDRDRPHPAPRLTRGFEHPHGQQRGPVEESNREAGRGHRANERHVLDRVMSDRTEPTGRDERRATERHALTVADQSMDRPTRWRGPHQQRRQERRMQPSQRRARTLEDPGHRGEIETVFLAARHQCRRQSGVRSRVSVERDDPVSARRVQTLLQRPRLADPSGRQRATVDDGGSCGRRPVPPCRRWIRRRRRSPRVTPGAPAIASRSGPILDASLRAGMTTLIDTSTAARGRLDRRAPSSGTGQPGQAGGRCQRTEQQADAHHRSSAATRSATMRALIATSGKPPPGWLEPPTRYRP